MAELVMKLRPSSLGLVFALLASLGLPGAAWADEIPARNQAVLMLRVLLYDRNLDKRVDRDALRVLVVVPPVASSARDSGLEMAAVLTQLAQTAVVGGRRIVVETVSAEGLYAALTKGLVGAVYLAPQLAAPAAVIQSTQRAGVLSFSGDRSAIEAGAVVGFARRSERITLLINLRRAKEAGADLDSALLEVAQVKED
jgi:hypothetical protein